jgi:hypothetical protein
MLFVLFKLRKNVPLTLYEQGFSGGLNSPYYMGLVESNKKQGDIVCKDRLNILIFIILFKKMKRLSIKNSRSWV